VTYTSPVITGKATLEEYHTAGRAMGVLRYFISEFDALEVSKVARGCDDKEAKAIGREIELASKHLDDFREAMQKRQ
jgi:hypothetical protein